MIRRRLFALSLLAGLALCAVTRLAPGGAGLSGRQHIFSMPFYKLSGAVVDTAGDATYNRILSYSTQYADTTAHSVAWTYSKSDSLGFWYLTNPTWDLVDVYWDSAGTVTKVHDDLLIVGRVLGDTTITDSLSFGNAVVPGYAIRDNAIASADIESMAVNNRALAAGAVDSIKIASQALYPAHIHGGNHTWTLENVLVTDSLHSHGVGIATGTDLTVGTVHWAGASDLVAADAIATTITRDTEWDTWAEHPALTSAKILVGNGSNVPTAVTPSGSLAMTNAGVFTHTLIDTTHMPAGATTWNKTVTGAAVGDPVRGRACTRPALPGSRAAAGARAARHGALRRAGRRADAQAPEP